VPRIDSVCATAEQHRGELYESAKGVKHSAVRPLSSKTGRAAEILEIGTMRARESGHGRPAQTRRRSDRLSDAFEQLSARLTASLSGRLSSAQQTNSVLRLRSAVR